MTPPHNADGSFWETIDTLVFDFDGTLAVLRIDFGAMREAVMDLARWYGRGPEDFDGGYVLEGIERCATALVGQAPEKAGAFRSAAHRLIETIELEAARDGGLFPFTRPALRGLSAAGFRIGVITRNFGGAVRTVFPDIDACVPVFIPREETPRVKPDPVHLSTAIRRLGASPEGTLMVGDHPMDLETGRLAGTRTAGVASGRIGREELADAGADGVFAHIGELADHLLTVRGTRDGRTVS